MYNYYYYVLSFSTTCKNARWLVTLLGLENRKEGHNADAKMLSTSGIAGILTLSNGNPN
jgi:hypothetical protein